MYNDGYQNIVNIDISETVIKKMAETLLDYPRLSCNLLASLQRVGDGCHETWLPWRFFRLYSWQRDVRCNFMRRGLITLVNEAKWPYQCSTDAARGLSNTILWWNFPVCQSRYCDQLPHFEGPPEMRLPYLRGNMHPFNVIHRLVMSPETDFLLPQRYSLV